MTCENFVFTKFSENVFTLDIKRFNSEQCVNSNTAIRNESYRITFSDLDIASSQQLGKDEEAVPMALTVSESLVTIIPDDAKIRPIKLNHCR